MSNDKISMRQLLALLFAALLSPAVRALPARTAAAAGRAGWLSSLAALPVVLALCWVLFTLARGGEGGLAQAFQRALGRPLGKLLTLLYLLWGVFLLCANARLFGLRFLSTSYRNAPLGLFIAALLAVALWLAWKKLPVLARAGQIFYLALAAALVVTLALGAFQVEPKNVLPVWVGDVPGVLRGTLSVLAVLGYAVFAAFLGGQVDQRREDRRRALRWGAAFCLALTALQWVCLGAFGPGLVQRMETPYFMMVKGVGVDGAFTRVESLVIALWVLSDLALLGLLLFACCTLAQASFGLRERKWAAPPLVLLAFAGALALFPDAFSLYSALERWVYPGNLLLGFVVPAAVLAVARLRGKG